MLCKKRFDGCQFHAADEDLHRLFEFLERRQGGGYADIGVLGVFFVRPRCARSCHGDACAFRQCDGSFGGVRQPVEADEVSAVGIAPAGAAGAGESLFEHSGDQFELRANDFGMLSHMFRNALSVFEEADVSELIELVVSDGLNAYSFLDFRYVLFACGNGGNSCSREGDLRGAGEFEVPIWVAGSFARFGDVCDMGLARVVEMR